jgi:hypothetical protein
LPARKRAGEALPPLKLTLCDRFGNGAALQPAQTPPTAALSVLLPGADGELQLCPELRVVAQQGTAEGGLLLTSLQLLGGEAAATGPDAPGLQLFASAEPLSHPTAQQAQVQPSRQGLPVAEAVLRVGLEGLPGMQPAELPLRLRAGAPHCLRLQPGHPWEAAGEGGEPALPTLQHGDSLPPFQLAAFDLWGNPTAPSADLCFRVAAECEATDPRAQEFDLNGAGVAAVEGARAVAAGDDGLQRWLCPCRAACRSRTA